MAPKITYFNVRGLAELLRMICKYGDLDFEDVRVSNEEWPELKHDTPFGQLPTYEEDGKLSGQSIAIARYLAKKAKLVGDTDWENLEIDSVVDTLTDLRLKATQLYLEKDPEKRATLKETLNNETIPFYLERLEKRAKENDGYMVAKKLTWADFYLTTCFDIFNWLLGKDAVAQYSNLLNVKRNVVNIPNIKKWIEVRPVTDH